MNFDKQKIIAELKLHKERIWISKIHNFIKPMPYYRVKLEYIPELENDGYVIITRIGKHTYIELNKKHDIIWKVQKELKEII